jgi:hypothetical protein
MHGNLINYEKAIFNPSKINKPTEEFNYHAYNSMNEYKSNFNQNRTVLPNSSLQNSSDENNSQTMRGVYYAHSSKQLDSYSQSKNKNMKIQVQQNNFSNKLDIKVKNRVIGNVSQLEMILPKVLL